MTKERTALDLWLKDVAPSPLLRKWFGHDLAKLAEFRMRYIAEPDVSAAVDSLRHICAEHPNMALLHAAKDPHISHALALHDYLN